MFKKAILCSITLTFYYSVAPSDAFGPFQACSYQGRIGVRQQITRRHATSKDNAYLTSIQESLPVKTKANSSRRQVLHQSWIAITAGSLLSSSPSHARNLPLDTGADESKTGTVSTLIPIVRLRDSLETLQQQITSSKTQQLPSELAVPNNLVVPRDELSFKRLFDAYSDAVSYKQKFVDQNAFLVYYSKGFDGPGRPSIEDGLPVKQTLQYGARNDAWVAWDDFLVEWKFVDGDTNRDDLLEPLKRTLKALDAYLSLAPAEDLEVAQRQTR